MIKKRAISLVCAAIMSVSAFVGCSDESAGMSDPKGIYCSINNASIDEYVHDIDDGMKSTISYAKREMDQNQNGIFSGMIQLKDEKFKLAESRLDAVRWFTGTFSVKDGEINFKYAAQHTATQDGSISKLSVSDSAEGRAEKAAIERMKDWSANGTYISPCMPDVCISDRISNDQLPLYLARNPVNIVDGEDVALRAIGDFLCVETYGFKLADDYKYGKNFVVNFNPIAAVKKDKYSRFNMMDGDEEQYQRILQMYQKAFGENLNTKIRFSDGEWAWIDGDGNIINTGEYQESRKYPGLVEMYVTSDSENNKTAIQLTPLFFYISGDEIYYPGFIKMN